MDNIEHLDWINESIENLAKLCNQYNINTREDMNNILKLVQMYNDLKKIGSIK